jgi:hypothetical protein
VTRFGDRIGRQCRKELAALWLITGRDEKIVGCMFTSRKQKSGLCSAREDPRSDD